MTHFKAIRFLDENDNPYGIKQVDNKQRVSSMPYTFDIVEGNVPNHFPLEILGNNDDVDNTRVDLWEIGGTYIFPDVAMQMEVVSSSAADAGVASYTSTATGGTMTTLVDTAQDFTAGSVVSVGDYILLDDDGAFGIVTGVAATTLTCAEGFCSGVGGMITPASGDNYRVIDVSAGGTGVQVVRAHLLDGAYAEFEEFIVTNGTTAVTTASSSIIRVQDMHTAVTGSGLLADGDIDLRHLTNTPIYERISATGNQSLSGRWTVPADKTAFIISWLPSAGATATGHFAEFILRSTSTRDTCLTPNVFLFKDIVHIQDGALFIPLVVPIKFPAKADIKVSVRSDSAAANVNAGCSLAGWYETN